MNNTSHIIVSNQKLIRTDNIIKKIYYFFMGVFIISMSLGQFEIVGIKSSYIALILVLISSFVLFLSNPNFFRIDKSKVKVLYVYLFFLIYALLINIVKSGLLDFGKNYFLGAGTGSSIRILGINMHNLVLEIAVEYGLIVLVAFSYLVIKPFLSITSKNTFNALTFAFMPTLLIISISSSSILKDEFLWISIILIYLSMMYYKKIDKEVSAYER